MQRRRASAHGHLRRSATARVRGAHGKYAKRRGSARRQCVEGPDGHLRRSICAAERGSQFSPRHSQPRANVGPDLRRPTPTQRTLKDPYENLCTMQQTHPERRRLLPVLQGRGKLHLESSARVYPGGLSLEERTDRGGHTCHGRHGHGLLFGRCSVRRPTPARSGASARRTSRRGHQEACATHVKHRTNVRRSSSVDGRSLVSSERAIAH
jgi:hypothetical protein